MRPWSLLTMINFFRTGANWTSDILMSLLHLVAVTTNCTATKIECFSYAKSLIIEAYYVINHFVNQLFLFVKIPSYLLYVWLLSFFVLVNKNNLNSKVIPNPSIYSCKLQFKWTSNQSIIVFKKSNTPLLPRWFGPRYSLSWVLSWDVSLALENFYTSSILKNEWKRNQYTSKVGWYS